MDSATNLPRPNTDAEGVGNHRLDYSIGLLIIPIGIISFMCRRIHSSPALKKHLIPWGKRLHRCGTPMVSRSEHDLQMGDFPHRTVSLAHGIYTAYKVTYPQVSVVWFRIPHSAARNLHQARRAARATSSTVTAAGLKEWHVFQETNGNFLK